MKKFLKKKGKLSPKTPKSSYRKKSRKKTHSQKRVKIGNPHKKKDKKPHKKKISRKKTKNRQILMIKESGSLKPKPIRICKIMNDHGEIIELPLEYPGDYVVHQDLNPLRHLEMSQFDSQYFHDLYNKYRRICSK